MRKFVLDTSIILHYVRMSSLYIKIEEELNVLSSQSLPIISSVTIGEMEGFVQRRKWGESKIRRLKNLISKLVVIDVASSDVTLMKYYATLLNYSKNAMPEDKLGYSVGITHNDIWIASLTKTINAELVTTDGDFDHLNGKWIRVHKY